MKIKSEIAYLLLGGNIGDRIAYLEAAKKALTNIYPLVAASSIYETAAWGDRSQQNYLNQALAVEVSSNARDLHGETRIIEHLMGRTEKGNYQPRTIDIDILLFGSQIVEDKQLIIPHPRMAIRQFVLVPLCEIAPDLVHPVLKKTIRRLLEECDDQLEVTRFIPEKT